MIKFLIQRHIAVLMAFTACFIGSHIQLNVQKRIKYALKVYFLLAKCLLVHLVVMRLQKYIMDQNVDMVLDHAGHLIAK